jgi:hypothetical protein
MTNVCLLVAVVLVSRCYLGASVSSYDWGCLVWLFGAEWPLVLLLL